MTTNNAPRTTASALAFDAAGAPITLATLEAIDCSAITWAEDAAARAAASPEAMAEMIEILYVIDNGRRPGPIGARLHVDHDSRIPSGYLVISEPGAARPWLVRGPAASGPDTIEIGRALNYDDAAGMAIAASRGVGPLEMSPAEFERHALELLAGVASLADDSGADIRGYDIPIVVCIAAAETIGMDITAAKMFNRAFRDGAAAYAFERAREMAGEIDGPA